MRGRLESSIQEAVVRYARAREFIAIKMNMGVYGSSGWPDYLFIGKDGEVFFIEFKAEGKEPTPLQLQRIKELGGRVVVYVVDNVPLGKQIIDRRATWL